MIGRLEPKHWALISSFLISTLTVIGGLDHLSDLAHPAIFAGLGIQLVTLIGAVFAGAPKNPNLDALVNPGRRDTDPILPNMGSVSDATRRNLP